MDCCPFFVERFSFEFIRDFYTYSGTGWLSSISSIRSSWNRVRKTRIRFRSFWDGFFSFWSLRKKFMLKVLIIDFREPRISVVECFWN